MTTIEAITNRPNFTKTDEEKKQLTIEKLEWRNEMRKTYRNFKKRGFCSANYEEIIKK